MEILENKTVKEKAYLEELENGRRLAEYIETTTLVDGVI